MTDLTSEEQLREVVNCTEMLVTKCTEDGELRILFRDLTIAIAAGSFRCGFEKGRLAGRAE